MLKSLAIENYALIDSLRVEWDANLNIITGETGAGKSILLGALGLLLGAKNEGQALKDTARNCVVEAIFNIRGLGLESLFEDNDIDYDEEITIRRVITPAGKSRAFVGDMPVQLVTPKPHNIVRRVSPDDARYPRRESWPTRGVCGTSCRC